MDYPGFNYKELLEKGCSVFDVPNARLLITLRKKEFNPKERFIVLDVIDLSTASVRKHVGWLDLHVYAYAWSDTVYAKLRMTLNVDKVPFSKDAKAILRRNAISFRDYKGYGDNALFVHPDYRNKRGKVDCLDEILMATALEISAQEYGAAEFEIMATKDETRKYYRQKYGAKFVHGREGLIIDLNKKRKYPHLEVVKENDRVQYFVVLAPFSPAAQTRALREEEEMARAL